MVTDIDALQLLPETEPLFMASRRPCTMVTCPRRYTNECNASCAGGTVVFSPQYQE